MPGEELKLRITADGSQASSVLRDVGRSLGQVRAPIAGLGEEMRTLAEQFSGFGRLASVALSPAGLAIAGVGVTIAGLGLAVKSGMNAFVEYGEEIHKLARETGATAEATSGLLYAFQRTGLGVDQVSKSLGIFSKHLSGVVDLESQSSTYGKSAMMVIREMGIEVDDANGKLRDMPDILLDLADRFKAAPDGPEKTALAMQLFGKSGKDMIQVLNLGKQGITELMQESQKYGLQLSEENVESVHKYVLAHKQMDQVMQGVKVQLGIALMPAMTAASQLALRLAEDFSTYVIPRLQQFGDLLRPLGGLVLPAFNLATRIGALALEGIGAAFRFVGQIIKPVISWFHDLWQRLKQIDWVQHWQNVKTWAMGVWGAITEHAKPVLEWLRGWAEWAVQALVNGVSWTVDIALPWVGTEIQNALTWLKNDFWPWAAPLLSEAWNWTWNVALPWVGTETHSTLTWLKDDLWPWASDKLSKSWDWTWNLAVPWVGTAIHDTVKWLKDDFWPWAGSQLKRAWNWTWDFAGNIVGELWPIIKGAVDWLANTFWPVAGPLLQKVWAWEWNILGTIAGDLWVVVKGALDWLANTFWPVAQPLLSQVWKWEWDFVGDIVSEPWKIIKADLDWLVNTFWPVAGPLLSETWNWAFNLSISGFDDLMRFGDWMKGLPPWLSSFIINAVPGGAIANSLAALAQSASQSGGSSGGTAGGTSGGTAGGQDWAARNAYANNQEADYLNQGMGPDEAHDKAQQDATKKYGFGAGGAIRGGDFRKGSDGAIGWAMSKLGQHTWDGLCEAFVETAYGNKWRFPSAKDAASSMVTNWGGKLSDAARGALVFFRPDPSNGNWGHVGISLGGGQFVSDTNAGVTVDSDSEAYWNRLFAGWGPPRLAKGGIVLPRPGGVPIIAGEAGRAEAVIPLDRAGGFGGGDTFNIGPVYLNGKDATYAGGQEWGRGVVDILKLTRRPMWKTG